MLIHQIPAGAGEALFSQGVPSVPSQPCLLCGAARIETEVCHACGATQEGLPFRGPDRRDALAPGTQLADGKYSVGGLLGRGGFGITYAGADIRLHRRVAVKELFPLGSGRAGAAVLSPVTASPADFRSAVDRFLCEARVLARFSHPSVVAVHDVFQENGTAYMVMEFLDGLTLAERLEQRLVHGEGPFPEAELLRLAQSLTDALDLMHKDGVLHRDIKPDNIMILRDAGGRESDHRAVFVDFGSAAEFGGGRASRQSTVITPGYAPLEQYGEQAELGPYTDVYGLAATLYHLATGIQPPAATDRAAGVLLRFPQQLIPGLSRGFDRALVHALEPRIEDRTRSAIDLFRELTVPVTSGATPQKSLVEPIQQTPDTPLRAAGMSRADRLRRDAEILRASDGAPDTGDLSREVLPCPVCRSSSLIDPAKTGGALRCPICRRGEIAARVPSHRLDDCPSCLIGQLVAVRQSGQTSTSPRQRLSRVGRIFRNARQPGPDRVASWAVRCDHCAAEFEDDAEARMWVATPGQLASVPAEHRGARRTRIEWAKLTQGLSTEQGTHACGGCGAEFDESAPNVLTPLSAPHDPHGAFALNAGKPIGVSVIRRMAAGKADPFSPGLLCLACTAEFHWTLWELCLDAFDAARDPYGIGARYGGRRLSWADWQRVARGLPLHDESVRLRDEATRELWDALSHAEITCAEPLGLPDRTASARGESLLLSFPASQYRPSARGWRIQDRGHLWVTEGRVLFHGQRRVAIPHQTVSRCELRVADRTALLCVDAWDQFSPFYVTGPPDSVAVAVGETIVRLPASADRVAELIRVRAR